MARWPARARPRLGDILSLARFVRGAGADGRIGTGFSLGPRGDSGRRNGALHEALPRILTAGESFKLAPRNVPDPTPDRTWETFCPLRDSSPIAVVSK